MKFIDQCEIEVSAGKGGNGIISFRKEAKVPRGGPDGGDGGNGGSVYFKPDYGVNTLLNLKYLHHIRAQDGENGRSKNQYGAKGQDIVIKVPYGTLVYLKDKLVHDITLDQNYLIAKGGKGGKGNVKFKSSRNSAPTLSENGTLGQSYKLNLVLKVLADIGFVGKPSAGKSTLLSVISNAKPKIADYDFTTLTPQLGLVKVGDNSFVAADLPGLIQGAALGRGLGHDFLKHIERCKVIAHIIDFGSELKNPIQDYDQIRQELEAYSAKLNHLPELVIANKSDLAFFETHLQLFQKTYPEIAVFSISALNWTNLETLKLKLMDVLLTYQKAEASVEIFPEDQELTINVETIGLVDNRSPKFSIKKTKPNYFDVTGPSVLKITQLIPLNSIDNFNRFNYKLKTLGVWKELDLLGVKNGDIVKIYHHELEWNSDGKDFSNYKKGPKK